MVQVIRRDRVETHRVDVGLMSGGQVEIRSGVNENDVVVAKAGALLREGDPVRAISDADVDAKQMRRRSASHVYKTDRSPDAASAAAIAQMRGTRAEPDVFDQRR